MNPPFHPRRSRPRATALLLALLVILAATFVLAGWASVLATRVVFSDEFAVAQKRRLAMLNAENLGRQWARRGMASNAIVSAGVPLTNGWGQFIANTNAVNVMNTSLTDSRLNSFGPFGSGGFSLSVSTVLSGQGFTNARTYFFRSRSPLLGGYPLATHTNATQGTNFSGLSVSTNEMPLVFAQASGTATAPAAATYLAFTNRTVVLSPGSTNTVPASGYPYTPMTSGADSVNSYGGLLPSATNNTPNRTFTINGIRAAMDGAFTNTPAVSDPPRSPDGSEGTFRIIGSPPGNREIFEPSFSRTPSMLLVGPPPDKPPEHHINSEGQVIAQRIHFFYFGQTFMIRLTSTGLQYQKGGSWVPEPRIDPAVTYVRMQSDGDIDHFDITGPITMTDAGGGGTDRAILFAPLDGSLVAIRENEISFSAPSGPFAAPVPAAAAYRRATFTESAILLMGLPAATTGFHAQSAMNPQNFQVRASVDGVPLLVLDPSVAHDFRDPSGDPVLAYAGNQAERLVLRVRSSAAPPILAAIDQDTIGGDPWRKVLLVFDVANQLNLENSSSALIFSYIGQGELGISLEDADSTGPFALTVRGTPGTANTATRITGGGGRSWNLAATFVNSPAAFTLSGNLTIAGGIRSNSNVTSSGGTLTLERNTAPGNLDLYTDRIGWIETLLE